MASYEEELWKLMLELWTLKMYIFFSDAFVLDPLLLKTLLQISIVSCKFSLSKTLTKTMQLEGYRNRILAQAASLLDLIS